MPIRLTDKPRDIVIETADFSGTIRVSKAGLMMREKGRRVWYGPMAWPALFWRGAKEEAEHQRRQRVKRKKNAARGLLSVERGSR